MAAAPRRIRPREEDEGEGEGEGPTPAPAARSRFWRKEEADRVAAASFQSPATNLAMEDSIVQG